MVSMMMSRVLGLGSARSSGIRSSTTSTGPFGSRAPDAGSRSPFVTYVPSTGRLPLCLPVGDEDELASGPAGSVANLLDDQAGRGQRVGKLGAASESQCGVRCQHRAIALEYEGRLEADQVL